jgi:dienelactone hydrolase
MLRKSVVGSFAWSFAWMGLAAAAGAACSSSNGSPADAGNDTGKTPPTDAGMDAKPHDGGSDGKRPDATDGDAAPTGPTARFTLGATAMPNYLDVPFPSDVYLTNGKIVDPVPGMDAVVTGQSQFITHELGKLNGFSRVALTQLYVDDPSATDGVATLDPTSLPVDEAACVADTSSVFVLDLSASGAAARIPCRAQFHDDRAFGMNVYRPSLAVGPGRGVVLQEGHKYVTVITSRVKTMGGTNVGASNDFRSVVSGKSKSSVYTTAYTTAAADLASALMTDHATIVDLAPYTTSTETSVLFKMRTNLDSVPVPTLAWDTMSLKPMGNAKFAALVGGKLPMGFTDTLDDYLGTVTAAPLMDGNDDPNSDLPVRAHNQLAAIGTAVFQAQNYLSPSAGYAALDDATFSFDSMGNVVPNATNPTAPIWVTFFIPTAAMPATGYPVVIVQHGLGESRANEAFDLANTFAAQGWMVAAIDSVTFGARAPEAKYQVDVVNNFASGGGGYLGPDGIADTVGGTTNGLNDFFGNLEDIGAIRDQFRQAEIDTSQLARVLESNPDLSSLTTNGTVPTIDKTRIAYFGNSLGAMEGAAAAAIEPSIQSWVLNVAGGGVMIELAPHGPLVAAVDLPIAGFGFGANADHLTESHPLMNLLQTVVDPGDPLDFAPYVVKSPGTVSMKALTPKNILQIQVVYDEYVANEANEALARGLGIGLAVPNVGTNGGLSTLAEVKDPTTIPDRMMLPQEQPDDAGLIHDTPMTGTTAVLVQTMPGQHGANFQQGLASHAYAIPYNQFTTMTPFVQLGKGSAMADPPFQITCSYVPQQSMAVRFLTDAFAGKVPNVTGFQPAVRDFDGDGAPDSTDSDPNNPNIQ